MRPIAMSLLSFSLIILLAKCQSQDIMDFKEQSPNPGEDSPDTVYKAGDPGADWTPEEIDSTRQRILQAITPIWPEKITIGVASNGLGRGIKLGEMTENVLIRLAFHDCIPYLNGGDEDRACDGCLNFKGMFDEVPSANKADHVYKFDPPVNTNNQHLGMAAVALERIYKSIDWPFSTPVNPNLKRSLYQSGKSRADLWQFAGLVALERTIERANRACDLDFHVRQQITILESRDACEIKLTKPLKFVTGRIDCDSSDEVIDCIDADDIEEYELSDAGFVTCKTENQPELMGDGKHLIEFGREAMNVDADKWMALQAIHSAVHAAQIGQKYTWFGSGYLGNMYFKMIANVPTYKQKNEGGDLSLTSCTSCTDAEVEQGKCEEGDATQGNSLTNRNIAVGDIEGNPIAHSGWRASCGYVWNTPESGPCMLRPISSNCPDNPVWDQNTQILSDNCYSFNDKETGDPKLSKNGQRRCKEAYFETATTETGYQFNLLMNGKAQGKSTIEPDSPYWDEPNDENWNAFSKRTKNAIKACAWSNQFAFPWEISLYWNLTVAGASHRAQGCPGLDDYEYGSVNPWKDPQWPYIKPQTPDTPRHSFQASPAMRCGLNDHTDLDGTKITDIIEEMAYDNENFAERFLEGWHQMTTNGQINLVNSPDNGWLGHYSLTQQGKTEHLDMSFEDFVALNAPVKFTDPAVDPFICGHRGHASSSCGVTFSQFFKFASEPDSDACTLSNCFRKGICD